MTILGILAIIAGSTGLLSTTFYLVEALSILPGAVPLGVAILIVSLLYYGTAYGFFKGLGWSWTLGIGVAIVALIINIIIVGRDPIGAIRFGDILWIIVAVITLPHITRAHVKAFFGRGVARVPPGPQPGRGSSL